MSSCIERPIMQHPNLQCDDYRKISGIRELIDDYDGFIVDLWGVIHNGVHAFEGAIRTLSQLRHYGKRIVFVTNTSRRQADIAHLLRDIGISDDLYDDLLSAGEAAYRWLTNYDELGLGSRCVVVGVQESGNWISTLPLHIVRTIEDAELIVAIGLLDPARPIHDYVAFLVAARRLCVPLICTNPDISVDIGGKQHRAVGWLAHVYQELGGTVFSFGKPSASIYRACLDAFDGVERSRIVAVGDSIDTDIAGGQRFGLATVLVAEMELGTFLTSEIEGYEFSQAMTCIENTPDFVISSFAW